MEISFVFLAIFFVVVFCLSLFSTWFTRKIAIKNNIGTFPDKRMIHSGFIPIMGGVGFISAFFVSVVSLFFFASPADLLSNYAGIFLGSLLIIALGVYDDIKGLNAPRKFFIQFLAAMIIILSGCHIDVLSNPFGNDIPLGWLSVPLTLLWIIGVTNAVNLLDGLDGLAAGVSWIALAVMSVVAFQNGNVVLFILVLALLAGILAFLKFNYHPASIFMGDTGSLFLGFILAVLSIKIFETSANNTSLMLSVIALAVPIGDTVVAFFRRLNTGNHPFKPDKEHLHHRLIHLGLTHRQAVLIIYALALMFGLVTLVLAFGEDILGFVLLLAVIIFSVFGLKRLGYLEARKYKTIYGDDIFFKVEKEVAPLSLKRFVHRLTLVFTDIIFLNLALYSYLVLRFYLNLAPETTLTFAEILSPMPMLLISIGWITLFALNDLYSMSWDISRFDKTMRISKTILFGVLVWFLLTLDQENFFVPSRFAILIYASLLIVSINLGRLLIIFIEKKLSILEYAPQNTLLVGATEKGRKLLKDIRKNPHLLYNIVGFVTKKGDKSEFSGLKSMGAYLDIPEIIRKYGIREIIIAINERSRDDILEVVSLAGDMKVVFKIIPQMYDVVSGHKTEEIIGHPLIRLFPDHMRSWQWLFKRLFDVFLSLFLLIVLLPFGLLFYFLLALSGVSSPLKIINTVGKNERIFGMLNFNIEDSKNWISRFLLKSNLYKFPELLNILVGSMSFVGPRPESPDEVLHLREKVKFYNRRFQIRPGLTGWAQVRYRYDESLKSKREHIKHDLFYLENMSLAFDMRILLRSVVILFFRRLKDV